MSEQRWLYGHCGDEPEILRIPEVRDQWTVSFAPLKVGIDSDVNSLKDWLQVQTCDLTRDVCKMTHIVGGIEGAKAVGIH